jgi:DNA-binding transcriptional ArsR family regulator
MRIFGNVILDYDSFKALSSHVRIDILKYLDSKQMTVTDLSKTLKISKSTAHKHLERLVEVGLIERLDANRKWVYYKITRKGIKILHPENVTVSFLLSWAILLVGVVLVALALYLVWFPLPLIPLDRTALSISSVIGVILLLSGGSLVMKSPIRPRNNDDEDTE